MTEAGDPIVLTAARVKSRFRPDDPESVQRRFQAIRARAEQRVAEDLQRMSQAGPRPAPPLAVVQRPVPPPPVAPAPPPPPAPVRVKARISRPRRRKASPTRRRAARPRSRKR
jgi:hypothetical protein